MKYQKIRQAQLSINSLIEKAENELAELKYKSECISQTLIFMESCDIVPHEPGRGGDNGERKKPSRGMIGEILDILSVDSKPACAKEILQCMHEGAFENCTINSLTGLLCQMTQNGRLGRIKKDMAFHYYINKGGQK